MQCRKPQRIKLLNSHQQCMLSTCTCIYTNFKVKRKYRTLLNKITCGFKLINVLAILYGKMLFSMMNIFLLITFVYAKQCYHNARDI